MGLNTEGAIKAGSTWRIRRQLALMCNDRPLQNDPHVFIRLWNNGWSASKLAKYYNMTERGVRKRLRRYRQLGWVVRTVNKSATVLLLILVIAPLAHALPPCATYIQPDCEQGICIGAICLFAGPNDGIEEYSNINGQDLGPLIIAPSPIPSSSTTINVTPAATPTLTATPVLTTAITPTITSTPSPAPAATPVAYLTIIKTVASVTCKLGTKTWQAPPPTVSLNKKIWTCIPN